MCNRRRVTFAQLSTHARCALRQMRCRPTLVCVSWEQGQLFPLMVAELARQLGVPTNRVTEILNGRRAITGDTALRLAHFFGTTAEFWLNLQSLYELRIAQKKAGKSIDRLPTLSVPRMHMRRDVPSTSSAHFRSCCRRTRND